MINIELDIQVLCLWYRMVSGDLKAIVFLKNAMAFFWGNKFFPLTRSYYVAYI